MLFYLLPFDRNMSTGELVLPQVLCWRCALLGFSPPLSLLVYGDLNEMSSSITVCARYAYPPPTHLFAARRVSSTPLAYASRRRSLTRASPVVLCSSVPKDPSHLVYATRSSCVQAVFCRTIIIAKYGGRSPSGYRLVGSSTDPAAAINTTGVGSGQEPPRRTEWWMSKRAEWWWQPGPVDSCCFCCSLRGGDA